MDDGLGGLNRDMSGVGRGGFAGGRGGYHQGGYRGGAHGPGGGGMGRPDLAQGNDFFETLCEKLQNLLNSQ